MTPAEIDALGFQLYRDPDLYIPMRDALEERGLTWLDWLESSGTLTRFAEIMRSQASLSQIISEIHNRRDSLSEAHWEWRDTVFGSSTAGMATHGDLCAAFRVPQVELQPREMLPDPDDLEIGVRFRYPAPSVALAYEVLKLCLSADEFENPLPGIVAGPPGGPCLTNLDRVVKDAYAAAPAPNVTLAGYRVRSGRSKNRKWVERMFTSRSAYSTVQVGSGASEDDQ